MDINWSQIITYALELLIPALLTFITFIFQKYCKAKINNEQLANGLDQAWQLLMRAVSDTNQTYIDALKTSQEGLTEQQQNDARVRTAAIFRQLVTDVAKTAIDTSYQSIDKYIDLNLEAAVAQVKYERGE